MAESLLPGSSQRGPKSRSGYRNVLSNDAESGSVQQFGDDRSRRPCCGSRKCCCFVCLLSTLLVLLGLLLVLFFVLVPMLAQQATDNSLMTVLNLHLSNATNDSIFMDASMQLTNAGALEATLQSVEAKAYLTDGSFVGTLKMPSIHAKANTGATFRIQKPLMVQDVTNFRKFAKQLLKGEDSSLVFKASPKLDVTLFGIKITTEVNLKKEMTLQGSPMQNAMCSNFTVTSATTNEIHGLSQITFSTSSSISMDFYDVQIDLYYSGQKIGYSTFDVLSIAPGYNSFERVQTIMTRNSNNSEIISGFVSDFMMGVNREMTIYGPIPHTNAKRPDNKEMINSVIDYSVNTTVMNMGSTLGNTILNGIITSESQTGWTVKMENGTEIELKGAYTTGHNTQAVNLSIISSSVNLYLWEPLEYKYDKTLVMSGSCNKTDELTHVRTGYGMYKHNPSKTSVDLQANGYESFFVIGEPMTGQYGYGVEKERKEECKIVDDIVSVSSFPCCYLLETLAAICRDNPGLRNDTSDELRESFIKTRLESNMTAILDGSFQVDLTYNEAFFPVYYGVEVYQGYLKDLYMDCPDITIIKD